VARGRPTLSLLEAGLLFCVVATVLAVFVPEFFERLRTNKLSEAPELLAELQQRAESYYATDWGDGRRHCLPPSAGPTPIEPSEDPVPVDFTAEDQEGGASWEALGFTPTRPIRFSYRYTTTEHGCGLLGDGETATITLSAEGDLDGDSQRSRFERTAVLTADGRMRPLGPLQVQQRIE
jgi:hypothetical protein